ncbi:MAG: hypothetical protein LBT38_06000 [Deltaproteobacteria bacterium]|jgi:hypothetical protein|nr:hypothetical protein [Deltaproteobacteria bacterium]
MTYIAKRKKGKTIHYYLAETIKEGDGAPKEKILMSLGTIEDIMAARQKPQEPEIPWPDSAQLYEFGLEAALLSLVERLGIIELMDELAPTPKEELSVGSGLVLAAFNEARKQLHKSTERFLAAWSEKSFFANFYQVPVNCLTGQSFWRRTLALEPDKLNEVFDKISQLIFKRYNFVVKKVINKKINVEDLVFEINEPLNKNITRIHLFYYNLSKALTSLLPLELEKLGFKMSVKAALNVLNNVKIIYNLYATDPPQKSGPILANLSPATRAYIEAFDLKKYLNHVLESQAKKD